MSCEFSESIYLTIYYYSEDVPDNETSEILVSTFLLASSPRNFTISNGDSDSDYEKMSSNYVDCIQKKNNKKVLYENNAWKMISNDKIDFYTKMVSSVIKKGRLVKVEKNITCEKR
ncbi:hypothetical protein QKU48_gp1231 [Fadolivirus algeromassiliense]|jgi:hypothetical protein|uniref:Uncharacterized protein n=1 Tax=Fadolivirus FV1/VV64 TaxID=3070911 RepID=A0A7D3UWC7_9VIRU|nr:hypothetical protein QKU48_gp1231 [Fadolivirus algeromassiliense]QKF94689.1 hypothetical protein Fadolivirus_1_1231 [Fadolivirus FV1/VV64]